MSIDYEDLQTQVAAALNKNDRSRARITTAADDPSPGDLYAFSATAGEGIEWAVVLRHSQDAALWFIVPYDQNPLVGTWDVAVPATADAGPGTLRCGYGIWVHLDDLPLGVRSGFLDPDDVVTVRKRLAALVGDERGIVVPCLEVDDSGDYQEWEEEVTRAAARLEMEFRRT